MTCQMKRGKSQLFLVEHYLIEYVINPLNLIINKVGKNLKITYWGNAIYSARDSFKKYIYEELI